MSFGARRQRGRELVAVLDAAGVVAERGVGQAADGAGVLRGRAGRCSRGRVVVQAPQSSDGQLHLAEQRRGAGRVGRLEHEVAGQRAGVRDVDGRARGVAGLHARRRSAAPCWASWR